MEYDPTPPVPSTPQEVQELLGEDDNYFENGDEMCGACHSRVQFNHEGSECPQCGRTEVNDARPPTEI